GCQDSSEAPGQDPVAALPHRRRRLPDQAGRARDRGDRQVPPQERPVGHRGRLRAGAALALRRRAADRGGRRPAQADRRLAELLRRHLALGRRAAAREAEQDRAVQRRPRRGRQRAADRGHLGQARPRHRRGHPGRGRRRRRRGRGRRRDPRGL
ncbi:MAG: SSU ribosomal protein S16p, partial [uncultured Friedmanniella sp.]